jgi:hypothetical protein
VAPPPHPHSGGRATSPDSHVHIWGSINLLQWHYMTLSFLIQKWYEAVYALAAKICKTLKHIRGMLGLQNILPKKLLQSDVAQHD